MNSDDITYVTRPTMPPLDEFDPYLKDIWHNKILTNNAKYHKKFEQTLAEYLKVKYISLFVNGTLALMTALRSLEIKGEVITTPFSFSATTHALHWNGIKPVFCDIETKHLNIDPGKIEAAVTPETTAILPVHVFGNPCDVERIQRIADTFGLKVIYDACHAFGVNIEGNSILNFGDLSVLSFHATKVFNTFEGGAIICHDEETKRRIDLLKNFGIMDEVTTMEPGINAKMNEFQAAYGLLQLKYIDDAIEKRKKIVRMYREGLTGIPGIRFLNEIDGVTHNYQNFPILINRKEYGRSRDEVYKELKKRNIYGRRYFYPLISQFPCYSGLPSASAENLPAAERITREVLCLPLFSELEDKVVSFIIKLIRSEIKSNE